MILSRHINVLETPMAKTDVDFVFLRTCCDHIVGPRRSEEVPSCHCCLWISFNAAATVGRELKKKKSSPLRLSRKPALAEGLTNDSIVVALCQGCFVWFPHHTFLLLIYLFKPSFVSWFYSHHGSGSWSFFWGGGGGTFSPVAVKHKTVTRAWNGSDVLESQRGKYRVNASARLSSDVSPICRAPPFRRVCVYFIFFPSLTLPPLITPCVPKCIKLTDNPPAIAAPSCRRLVSSGRIGGGD